VNCVFEKGDDSDIEYFDLYIGDDLRVTIFTADESEAVRKLSELGLQDHIPKTDDDDVNGADDVPSDLRDELTKLKFIHQLNELETIIKYLKPEEIGEETKEAGRRLCETLAELIDDVSE